MLSLSSARNALVGAQMLFVAFGALVLVPLLTGLDANVALFTAGVGTLIFQLVTNRQVPIFLASSFAFIAPIIYSTQQWGIAATMGGLMGAGIVYVALSVLITLRGTDFLHRLFPPVVIGPVIMVIGLGLAPVAVNMAMGKTGDGSAVLVEQNTALMIAAVALGTTMLISTYAKGFFKLIPILFGIIAGYLTALASGIIDFTPIQNASWFSMPAFTGPEFNINAILFMLPVALAPAIEHIGDVVAIGGVTGKDYLQKPGLNRTLLGDGLATSAAAAVGGPPNTTYSEVTGAVMLTKSFNPTIMTWAAVFAVLLAFIGKVGAILQTIPVPVMGGILILLFGTIAAVGLNTLLKARLDLGNSRNLIIVSLVLVLGLGNMALTFGEFNLQGVGLCAVAAVILNLILPNSPGGDRFEGDQA